MPKGSIEPRKTQTKVKHTILDRYLKAWGGIILRGLKARSVRDAHFVYVDCHASFGRYDGEIEEVRARKPRTITYGSPIIGIKALDSLAETAQGLGIRQRTNAILIEEIPKVFVELKRSLDMAGFGSRLCQTENFSDLNNGEIAIVNGDSTLMTTKLVDYTQSQPVKFSFYFLDPYGPKGIPLGFVSEIIRCRRQDVMINMPYLDLDKKQGLVTKLELGPEERELIGNYDEMFGNKTWQNIVRQIEEEALFRELGWNRDSSQGDELSGDETEFNLVYALAGDPRSNEQLWDGVREAKAKDLEIRLINCYKDSLLSVDSEITVKSIGLRFPEKERTIYYLYLTTHDPDGALAMNKVLWEAHYQEHELRWRFREAKSLERGQLSMFDNSVPHLPGRERPSKEVIANNIAELLRGQTLTRKQIYRALADQPHFNYEIDSALKSLRKEKRASFQDPVKNKTRISIAAR